MRIKTYRHVTRSTGAVAGVGTSMATGKRITLDTDFWPSGSPFIGRLHSLIVQVSSISSAATITWRITSDLGGDESLITDTAGSIYAGVTTATDGSASFRIDLDVALVAGDTMYFFAKVDAGSVTIDSVALCWEE
jgi:hypothetical protein